MVLELNHKVHKGIAKGITIVALTMCSAAEKFFVASLKDFDGQSKNI